MRTHDERYILHFHTQLLTVTTYFTGELMGSRREQVYIVVLLILTVSIDHSGVNLVNVSLGSFAQYLHNLQHTQRKFLSFCLYLSYNSY